MAREWRNWAGDQRCRPALVEAPRSRDELIGAVRRARERGLAVRAAGSGHSFSDVACTDGVMLRLGQLDRVLAVDRERGLAKVEAGIVLGRLNERLAERGLAFENLGDIDRQTIAGSISTATHGTGAGLQNISAQIAAVELVDGTGAVREISADSDLDLFSAVRVGLGAVGPIYAVTVRCVPSFTLRRIDSPRPLDEVLASLDELNEGADHFEFYVFPHTRTALCRESRRTDEPPRPRPRSVVYAREVMLENWVGSLFALAGRHLPRQRPRLARMASRGVGRSTKVDRSYRVFASERRIRFTEMEYAIPREHAADATRRVLALAERDGAVAFPIEIRFVAADDAHLSPAHERESCYLAVHQDRKLDWKPYFRGVEAIMADYGGRPHWGKRHFQTAETLAPLYPRWADFQRARAQLDPDGVFRNAYTDRVLGPVQRNVLPSPR